MKFRIRVIVALVLCLGLGVSVWNVAKAAPRETTSLLQVGKKYTIGVGTLSSPNVRVIEIRPDGWVKIKTHRGEEWWLNVDQVWGIMEKE